MFGWGTSGFNHGATCYQPWSTSYGYYYYYAYGNSNSNLNDQSGQADWGYNAISNGGNMENSGWRTLTHEEWDYVFNTRSTASGIRYANACVDGVNGVILLPDDWSADYYILNNTNGYDASFNSNTITAIQWSTLEQHGAVFLPATGYRLGTSVYYVGSYGFYWSASYNNSDGAWDVYFGDSYLITDGYDDRCNGRSVRLVRSFQGYSFVIDATPSPVEGGAVSGAGTYEAGAECTLKATASAGYHFAYWTQNGRVVSLNAKYTFTVGNNRDLVANFAPDNTTGCLNGVFSTGENTSVMFSQGNLQYRASTNTWRFAENQWDYVGSDNSNASSTYSSLIDLFGWGTSGYNHNNSWASTYQPWCVGTWSNNYRAYGSMDYNLYDQTGQADWGYNAISNGGNTENSGWRTMTYEEWSYLLNTRNTESGIRYALAQVNGINGAILLPDDWSTSYYALNNTDNNNASFSSNIITATQWITLEQHGAVFLPAAGSRYETSVYSVGAEGHYWSASHYFSNYERSVRFTESYLDVSYSNPCYGQSVRLVRSHDCSVNVAPNPTEGGVASGSGTYEAGAECTLTATASAGYHFAYWTQNGRVVSLDASYTFTVGNNHDLVANFAPNSSSGCLNGVFTTGENSSVLFSQGNLQYKASTDTWRFAENQWDYIGSDNSNASSIYSGLIDLFGWGTSGYNHGANCYQPWSTSQTYSDYYAYGSDTTNLFDQSGQADWGYNAISNGGNTENSGWRTMTYEEWSYLLNTRNTESGIRYAKAQVNGVIGVILLPDDWSADYYYLSSTNYDMASFSSNVITETQWTALEMHGAVFLPVAGYRIGTSVYFDTGMYWSSSGCGDASLCTGLYDSDISSSYCPSRSRGASVRLVRDFQVYSLTASVNPSEGGTISFNNSKYDFEAGVIPEELNNTVSSYPWTVLSTNPNSGSFCMASSNNAVGNSESYVDAVVEFVEDGSVDFYSRISSESDYDWGRFYIDGAEMLSESGTENTWTARHYDVSAGTHTFRWYYSKDGSYNEGEDCYYIDDITFTGISFESISIVVDFGETYKLNAIPNEGYAFINWTEDGEVVSTEAEYTFTMTSDRNLVANFEPLSNLPTGAINGLFSVGENATVFFSQGNLQYIGSAATPYWKFADNQWDYLGTTTGQNSDSQNVDRDLFGWGTSGYNHGANCYQPWSTSQTSNDFNAYGIDTYNLYDQTGQADWGYNAIVNGGNTESSGWHTLTKDEWNYLFNIRSTVSGIRYVKAQVNGINGVILLPDDWIDDYYPLNNTNNSGASFGSNTIAATEWTALEQHGVVFLPAAGNRLGTSLSNVGSCGRYWSASIYDSYYVSSIFFDDSSFGANGYNRGLNYTVRLVCSSQDCSVNAVPNSAEGGSVIGSGAYEAGVECTLTAVPSSGFEFLYWTENGVVVSMDLEYTFWVVRDRNLVANFTDNSGTGVLNGVFSVSASDAVYFSQGNLQYQASTNKWQFATNQWDYVGGYNGNIAQTYTGWIDLFGWGTSGYNHGAVCYQPWSTSTSHNSYYAYGSNTYQLYDQTGQADWGYNAISNGGNQENSGWRTLTKDEWNYLFNTRSTASGIRYAKAQVNGINGVILLPDDWNADYFTLNSTNTSNSTFSSNLITRSQWAILEQHGAVFLPAAGSRSGTSVYNIGSSGCYWSANNSNYFALCLSFSGSGLNAANDNERSFGQSVRLVRIAQDYAVVNAAPNPAEGGTLSGVGAWLENTECALTATANEGYVFVNWTENGEVVSTDANYSFIVTGSRTLVANFRRSDVGIDDGALTGHFSVAANRVVHFSQGNLQYIGSASTPYWKFAEHQWDYLGNNGQGSDLQTANRDLFGWGTSGYNHGATCYQPWSTSQTNTDYSAYGSDTYSLFDQTGQADWGYNAISNGGNQENSGWRTLTKDEWNYLFNTRITLSGIRYAKAMVNTIYGVILLPDDWNVDYYSLNSTNSASAYWSTNSLDVAQWAILEQHGAVFLPAAGYRIGTSVNNVGSYGDYWSATNGNGEEAASAIQFSISSLGVQNNYYRKCGFSVRLVRAAQGSFNSIIGAMPSPAEGGTVSGAGAYQAGAGCTLTATANEGYTFVNWTENGEVVSTEANYTFIVTGSRMLVANFRRSDVGIDGGALTGHFSVADNRVVSFSQGNLQYIGSAATPYWKFAEHQWDHLGINGQESDSPTANRDLFGWGASGYNHGATCYQPWSTSQTNTDYSAYGSDTYSLFDQTGQADWGYNAISNGGDQENSGWRTLTKDEWNYLFYTRSTLSGKRYAKAQVNGVNGMILLPDDWSVDYYSLNSTNSSGSFFSNNTLTAAQWAILEQHGAVFLPAAGYRIGTSMYNVGSYGDYWSATNGNDAEASSATQFYDMGLGVQDNYYRKCGFSVRLVRLPQGYAFIDATSNPLEGGSVSGIGDYAMGAECTLTASANEGYTFVNWTEDGEVVSTEAEYTFTVTCDRTLVAHFVQEGGEAEQPVDLAPGWNWWSTYLEADDALFSDLKGAIAENNTSAMIKSANNSIMLQGGTWTENPNNPLTLDNASMYMLNIENAVTATLNGQLAAPAEHEITLLPGWNWIGFVSATPMSIEDAFAGITPNNGDMVKGSGATASYTNHWNNAFVQEPGKGYMYYNCGTEALTLVYPATAKAYVRSIPVELHWNTDPHRHATNLSVMATLDASQYAMGEGNYEIGAFCGEECRGSARLQLADGQYMTFMVVNGEPGETIRFKLYDVANGRELGLSEETLTYEPNAIVGSVPEPEVLHFRGTSDVDEMAYRLSVVPNPADREQRIRVELPPVMDPIGATIEVYDALGALVATGKSEGRDVELGGMRVSGLYTVRVTDRHGKTCFAKFVVK